MISCSGLKKDTWQHLCHSHGSAVCPSVGERLLVHFSHEVFVEDAAEMQDRIQEDGVQRRKSKAPMGSGRASQAALPVEWRGMLWL